MEEWNVSDSLIGEKVIFVLPVSDNHEVSVRKGIVRKIKNVKEADSLGVIKGSTVLAVEFTLAIKNVIWEVPIDAVFLESDTLAYNGFIDKVREFLGTDEGKVQEDTDEADISTS